MPGLMPLMMQSASSSRTALAILMKWSAVLVSITSMPVISTMAVRACLAMIVSSSVSVISALRWLSTMPTTGRQSTPDHTSMIGVYRSRMAACCISIVASFASSSRLATSVLISASRSCRFASASSSMKMVNAVSSSENSSSLSRLRSRLRHESKSSIEAYDSASMMRSRRLSWIAMAPSPLLAMSGAFRRGRGLVLGVDLLPPLFDPLARLRLVGGEVQRDALGLVGEHVERGEDQLGDHLRLDRRVVADHAAQRDGGERLGGDLAHLGVDAVELRQVDEKEDARHGGAPLQMALVDLQPFGPGDAAAQLEEDDLWRFEVRRLVADVRFTVHDVSPRWDANQISSAGIQAGAACRRLPAS